MADIEEYTADIKKYTASVDAAAVAGLAKTYASVMAKADSRYVAASDADEVKRVATNFCQKKLGRKESADDLCDIIDEVLLKMKGVRTKSRVTVYYLIAEHFKQLDALKA